MTKKKKILIKLLIILLIIIFIVSSLWLAFFFKDFSEKDIEVGVNFSISYAKYLEIDWQKAYLEILDDLKVKKVRLSAQWNDIEPEKGEYYFKDLDWLMMEAKKRDVQIILVVGLRVPRFPECHFPDWVDKADEESYFIDQLEMMEAVVKRYKSYSNLEMWQVENEPFVKFFGHCPVNDLKKIKQEVSLVEKNDPSRPILITDSGELSTWVEASSLGDYFGTTLYRVVWNDMFGYIYYHLPPAFYNLKTYLVGRTPETTFIPELQGEPWAPGSIKDYSIKEQFKSMDPQRLVSQVDYARRTGFSRAYLWGAEWWYWLKDKHQNDEMWEAARDIFNIKSPNE